jgi:hypothetical protein
VSCPVCLAVREQDDSLIDNPIGHGVFKSKQRLQGSRRAQIYERGRVGGAMQPATGLSLTLPSQSALVFMPPTRGTEITFTRAQIVFFFGPFDPLISDARVIREIRMRASGRRSYSNVG